VRARRLVALALGLAPGVLLIAIVHTLLYGSPLRSGYGSNADLYALANIPENARLYSRWLVEGQTLMPLLAFGAGFFRPRPSDRSIAAPPGAATTIGRTRQPLWPLWLVVGLVYASYLPYAVFEDWWYIRFLLPEFPAAFVLVALCLVGLSRRLPAPVSALALGVATAALVGVSVVRAGALHTLDLGRDERRYAQMADALSTAVPAASAFVAMQHSGSLNHYLGRPVLRWELLPPERLDAAFDYVRSKGYHPYIVLDSWEASRFRERFERTSRFGSLDWPPILELRSPTPVRLFDPADRDRYLAGANVATRLVFQPRR
jgi:hypothetical protein